MEDRYVYILNLTRYRIFLLGTGFVVVFIFLFVLGLAIGIQSTKFASVDLSNDEIKSLNDDGNVYTETFNSLDGESPESISRKGQLRSIIVSSADLLAQDNKPLTGDNKLIEKNALKQNQIQEKKNYRVDNSAGRVIKNHPNKRTDREKTRIAPVGYKPKYFIQLLVSGDKNRAERIVQKLLKDEFKGYMRSNKVNGKTYYAVRVGLYTNKNKASRDLKKIKEKGIFIDAYIKVNIPSRS